MQFILATHNEHKEKEMQAILSPLQITVQTAKNAGFTLTPAIEDGETFEENAYKKAVLACEETGLPAIADDSGLCVDALGGAPGVYSARYAGEDGNDKANNQKLLLEMSNEQNRKAQFVCVMCCVFPSGERITVRGELHGEIGKKPEGVSGFGYDPLFCVGDRTLAQMSEDEKNTISHRGKAARLLAQELNNYFNKQ